MFLSRWFLSCRTRQTGLITGLPRFFGFDYRHQRGCQIWQKINERTVQKEEEKDAQDEPEASAEAQLPMTEAALKLGLEEWPVIDGALACLPYYEKMASDDHPRDRADPFLYHRRAFTGAEGILLRYRRGKAAVALSKLCGRGLFQSIPRFLSRRFCLPLTGSDLTIICVIEEK